MSDILYEEFCSALKPTSDHETPSNTPHLALKLDDLELKRNATKWDEAEQFRVMLLENIVANGIPKDRIAMPGPRLPTLAGAACVTKLEDVSYLLLTPPKPES
jgi:hypothetical protein